MYKQNDEQTLIHTKVTLGEQAMLPEGFPFHQFNETKSLHLCQITTCHTPQVYTSKIY